MNILFNAVDDMIKKKFPGVFVKSYFHDDRLDILIKREKDLYRYEINKGMPSQIEIQYAEFVIVYTITNIYFFDMRIERSSEIYNPDNTWAIEPESPEYFSEIEAIFDKLKNII